MTAGDPARRPPTENSGGAARSGSPAAGEPADTGAEARAPRSEAATGADPDTSDPARGAPAADTAGADAVRPAGTGTAGVGAEVVSPLDSATARVEAADGGRDVRSPGTARSDGERADPATGAAAGTGPADTGASPSGAGRVQPGLVPGETGTPESMADSAAAGHPVAAGTGDSAAPDVAAGAVPGASPVTRPRPIDWGDEEITPPAGTGGASTGRQPVAALVLLAVGAAALWGSSRLTWVTVTSEDGLTEPRTDELNGGVWFGALTPLALVLLAAIAAVLATKGWVRRLVGVVVALIAAVTAVPALALLTGSGATGQRAADLAGLPGRAQVQELVTSPVPAVLTLCGALAAFGAGLLLARMPAGTRQLSGKYDNPATRKAAATHAVQQRGAGDVLPERVLWDALDAGTDPTEAADPTGSAGPR
ncbi:TIGR02234 family membrane protein [Nocardia flavorosea]|uniref:TIGR02234 family membrane protein n=1 Tax=Nocardia flavorosea TaxID=53429 RepID=UPI003A5CBBBA